MIAMMPNKLDIQSQMNWLIGQDGDEYPEAIQSYFEHYGLDWPQVEHRFGWFESGGLKLAGHVWVPPKIKNQKLKIKNADNPMNWEISTDFSPHKGVRNDNPSGCETAMVIVLHGYLNHTGQLKHLIAALLESGLAVGSFDLPGHGLSEGQSAAVGAFEDYTQALLDFVLTIRAFCPGPLHFVGFSTGAGIGIELLLNDKEKRKLDSRLRGNDTSLYSELFDKVVLAAPLIHWRGYSASKATYAFCRTFTDKVRRMPQKNSSDNNFLSFNRSDDYLHCRYVSLDWVRALYDWNDRLEAMPVCDKEVLILQGDRDTTVDWRYNIRLLKEKFPAAKVEVVQGARHELFNESIGLRKECLTKITAYLLDGK
jgi:lysophospholipase